MQLSKTPRHVFCIFISSTDTQAVKPKCCALNMFASKMFCPSIPPALEPNCFRKNSFMISQAREHTSPTKTCATDRESRLTCLHRPVSHTTSMTYSVPSRGHVTNSTLCGVGFSAQKRQYIRESPDIKRLSRSSPCCGTFSR